MKKKYQNKLFKFRPFSVKQRKLLNWWRDGSPYKDCDIMIADGSIRSGKTIACICSFLQWSQEKFESEFFIIAGKTIGSLKKNVIKPMLSILSAWGWEYEYNRSENYIVIGTNTYYMYDASNESSQDKLQGLTAAGALADEVGLFPKSFIDQMIGRCSVEGSKIFFNCNPEGPQHYIKVEFIDKAKEKNIYHLHFMMDDNLTLSEKIKDKFRRMFSGVFYQRFILGKWVVADGAIYKIFSDNVSKYIINSQYADYDYIQVGIDFGGNGSAHTFVATGLKNNYSKLTVLCSERHEAKGLSPEDLYNLIKKFIERVENKYGKISVIYADSAEQTLINGIRAMQDIPVRDSIKNEIIDRIRATTSLMAQEKFYMTEDCKTLEIALCEAVYDEKIKNKDVRLDDGTSDIDTLDAFEYSWERHLKMYERSRAA